MIVPSSRKVSSDLCAVRCEIPYSWARLSAATGPDARRLYAAKDGQMITAWTAGELAAGIRREEADPPPDRAGPIP